MTKKIEEKLDTGKKQFGRFNITLTDRTLKMVEEIMVEEGFASLSELIRGAIGRLHKELTTKQFYRSKGANKTSSADRKQEEADREEKEKLLIADELGGEVKVLPDGSKVCVYYTYVGRKRYDQEVSLGLLDRMMLNNQYTPSREAVERLQKEGKCEY